MVDEWSPDASCSASPWCEDSLHLYDCSGRIVEELEGLLTADDFETLVGEREGGCVALSPLARRVDVDSGYLRHC